MLKMLNYGPPPCLLVIAVGCYLLCRRCLLLLVLLVLVLLVLLLLPHLTSSPLYLPHLRLRLAAKEGETVKSSEPKKFAGQKSAATEGLWRDQVTAALSCTNPSTARYPSGLRE